MQKTTIFAVTILALSGAVLPAARAQAQQQDEVHQQGVAQGKIIQDKIVQDVEDRIVIRSAQADGNTFLFVGGQMFNGKPVKNAPYSADAVTETTQTLADGNHIVNRSTTTIYRDSEGRERREESIGKLGAWNAQGEPAKVVFISDPVAKASYTLHPDDHTAERVPGRPGMMLTVADGSVRQKLASDKMATANAIGPQVTVGYARRDGAENPSEVKTEQLPPQMIEGVMAQGTRTTRTIPAGTIGNERDISVVSERWFSNELGVVVMTKQSDPRTGETVYKLTNINRTEPQHSLFEIPADYTVSDGGAAMKELREMKLRKEEEEQQPN